MDRYFTQNMMNRPVTMMGYSSGFLFLLFLGVVVLSLALYNIGIVVLIFADSMAIMGIVMYGKKLNKERLRGNPSYLDGVRCFASYPKKVKDGYRVIRGLINSHRKNG